MTDYDRIPPATLEELRAWIQHGRSMGSFCEAVVRGDLFKACAHADEANAAALHDIACWLRNEAPLGAWGSPTVLASWPAFLRDQKRRSA